MVSGAYRAVPTEIRLQTAANIHPQYQLYGHHLET